MLRSQERYIFQTEITSTSVEKSIHVSVKFPVGGVRNFFQLQAATWRKEISNPQHGCKPPELAVKMQYYHSKNQLSSFKRSYTLCLRTHLLMNSHTYVTLELI